MRLEGIASGYWTRLLKPSSGLISHCSSNLLPSVGSLGDEDFVSRSPNRDNSFRRNVNWN